MLLSLKNKYVNVLNEWVNQMDEYFFEDVEKKLKRIGRKCEKHGNSFVYNVIGTEIKEVIDKETRKTNVLFFYGILNGAYDYK